MVAYSDDLWEKMMKEIERGKGVAAICREEWTPSQSNFYIWLDACPERQERYTRARERQADYFADQIVEISDDSSGDWQRDRLRVDARKWTAAKLRPKKYGDRVTHAGDAENPIATKELSDTEYARRIAYTLQRAARSGKERTEGDDAPSD